MTELLHAEFVDETGTTRRLTRNEVATYVSVLAGAGNDTTLRTTDRLGRQGARGPPRAAPELVEPFLDPNAIEEILRYEPPAPHVARYVARDVEHFYGQQVPEGSVMMLLVGDADRDPRRYPDPHRFDIHREVAHLTLGHGIHYCLGAALARLEGRVALEEVLKRFPEWEVDLENARLAPTSTVRGYETLRLHPLSRNQQERRPARAQKPSPRPSKAMTVPFDDAPAVLRERPILRRLVPAPRFGLVREAEHHRARERPLTLDDARRVGDREQLAGSGRRSRGIRPGTSRTPRWIRPRCWRRCRPTRRLLSLSARRRIFAPSALAPSPATPRPASPTASLAAAPPPPRTRRRSRAGRSRPARGDTTAPQR